MRGGQWWGLPAQVNEVVWECGPLPRSLYGVCVELCFSLGGRFFFFFKHPYW